MIKITKILSIAKLNETDPSLFINSGKTDRICNNCKKSYKLTDADISTRRPSTYFKQCSKCRDYLRERGKIYLENKIKIDRKY
jgi:hypothetical protein